MGVLVTATHAVTMLGLTKKRPPSSLLPRLSQRLGMDGRDKHGHDSLIADFVNLTRLP